MLMLAGQDPLVRSGFDHFFNLEYPESIADFRKALSAAPDDPDRHNHLAQAVLFQMLFRAGVLDSQLVTGNNPFERRPRVEPPASEKAEFEKSIARSIQLCDAKIARNPNDAGALYSKGVALGFRGTYNFLVKRAWLDALHDVTDGRKLHNRVTELDPSNYDARLTQGFHDYIVGSLPWAYRMLGFLAGFHGDKDSGLRTVKLVSEKGDLNRVDAMILLGIAYRRESRSRDVIPILQELIRRYPRNYLYLFEISQMYADLEDLPSAKAALDRIDELKRQNTPGFRSLPRERIEFARGNLLFWYDDHDQAIVHLQSAARGSANLDPPNAAMNYLRLGQCLDLKGLRQEAKSAYTKAVESYPKTDAGKEAKKYLGSAYRRADFMRARGLS